MKVQKPAEGILLQRDYGKAKVYKVACECGDANHAHDVWVEVEDYEVVVTTYTQQKTKWWESNRWATIWTLLTKGYVEYEASIIMSKQQALNYANVLQSAVKDVEDFRKEKTCKN